MKTLADADDRISVVERIKTVQAGNKARWGRMSSHQMICHCADAFRTALGQKTVRTSSSLVGRTAFKWMALYFPAPWPKNVATRPEVEQGKGGTAPSEFLQDRRDLLRLMEAFCHPDAPLEGKEHPLFGPVTVGQWRRWGFLHMDHHLRQFGA